VWVLLDLRALSCKAVVLSKFTTVYYNLVLLAAWYYSVLKRILTACLTCCILYSSNVHSLPQTVQSVRRKRRTQLKSTPVVDIRTSFSYKGHRWDTQVAHQVEGMCDREGEQRHALITLCQWRSLILIHSHTKRENRTERGFLKDTRHYGNS